MGEHIARSLVFLFSTKLVETSQFTVDALQDIFTGDAVMFGLLQIVGAHITATAGTFSDMDFFDMKILRHHLKPAASVQYLFA